LELITIQCFPALIVSLVLIFTAREAVTYQENYKLKYIFTPMVTALIAGLVILILIALLMSLIADTMLMVVEVDLMEEGILYFLLAHVFYGIAFSLTYAFRGWNTAVAAILFICLIVFYRGIRSTVGKLRIPILIYTIVLSAMLFFAIASLNHGITRREICIVAGALLFAVSDFLIVYLTFIKPHKKESVIVWAVYAPAQTLLALSCFS
jgi:uncharacterized membrane protein YhhN